MTFETTDHFHENRQNATQDNKQIYEISNCSQKAFKQNNSDDYETKCYHDIRIIYFFALSNKKLQILHTKLSASIRQSKGKTNGKENMLTSFHLIMHSSYA